MAIVIDGGRRGQEAGDLLAPPMAKDGVFTARRFRLPGSAEMGASFMSAAGMLNGTAMMVPPQILATSDTSRTLPGIAAAGTYNGSRSAHVGTSFSAPQVTRKLALEFANLSDAGRSDFSVLDWVLQQTAQSAEVVRGSAGFETAQQSYIRPERLVQNGPVLRGTALRDQEPMI